MTSYFNFLMCELKNNGRQWHEVTSPFWFFILICVLFPLGINPNPEFLQNIAPGVIWISILLSILLSFNHLFKQDFDQGLLEQWIINETPLSTWVSLKLLSHWTLTCLPIILISPLLGLLFQLPLNEIGLLMLTLILGTPILILLGAVNAALMVSLGNQGILLALLTLPLYIPTLIFAANCLTQAHLGLPVMSELALLAAMNLIALSLLPFVVAHALKIGLHS